MQRAMQYDSIYDVLEPILNAIKNENFVKISSEWTRNRKLVLENLENRSWEASVALYGSINVYRNVMKIQGGQWFWWKFVGSIVDYT